MFITFEGVDGVGKSTQIQLFCQWLVAAGHRVTTCRDPGSTQLGETLRHIVLQDRELPIHRRAEMMLYMAARAQMVEQLVLPALNEGHLVVSDRFLLANVVYQGYAGGLGPEAVWQVGQVAVAGRHPDLTVVLDMDVQRAAQRRQLPPDRIESQGLAYLQQVRQGYLAEAERNPRQLVVVDADGPVQQVQQAIRHVASQRCPALLDPSTDASLSPTDRQTP
jgi:dTMP kinase